MNKIRNKFLLAGDKFMPEMHLRQPETTYSACGPFTKNKESIQIFKETGDSKYIYQNELDKTCFQHEMAYADIKDLPRRTIADKNLRDKALKITQKMKYDGYQRGLASMAYEFFSGNTALVAYKSPSGGAIKIAPNKELEKELYKLIIKKFEKRKVHPPFVDNIWGNDIADVQLLNNFNKGICFLLCIIDIFNKYVWVVPLRDKKRIWTQAKQNMG